MKFWTLRKYCVGGTCELSALVEICTSSYLPGFGSQDDVAIVTIQQPYTDLICQPARTTNFLIRTHHRLATLRKHKFSTFYLSISKLSNQVMA